MENFKISKTFDERIQEAIKKQKEQEVITKYITTVDEEDYKKKYLDLLKEFNKYKEDTREYLKEADKIKIDYKDLQIAYFKLYNKK